MAAATLSNVPQFYLKSRSQDIVSELETLTWGSIPRGRITEVAGARSTGRTAFLMTTLARATQGGEACAVVDAGGRFDPASAAQAGVKLDRLLWVRCDGRLDAAFRSADLLLHGGGFGIIALDLCDAAEPQLRRVPISYWYRFRRAVEGTPSALMVLASRPVTGSCAALQVETRKKEALWRGTLPFPLLEGAVWEASARKPVFAGVDAVRAQAG